MEKVVRGSLETILWIKSKLLLFCFDETDAAALFQNFELESIHDSFTSSTLIKMISGGVSVNGHMSDENQNES